MNEILKLFFSLSISGSLLAIMLFAIKPLVRDRLSKRWQYYIWIIVVLRLLIPATQEFSITGGLFNRVENEIIFQQASDIPEPPLNMTGERLDDQQSQINIDKIVPTNIIPPYWNDIKTNIWLLWIGVAVMLFVRKVTSYHSFLRYVKAGTRKATDTNMLEIYNDICVAAGIKKPLPIYTNSLVASPMLVGIFRPIIIIPDLEVDDGELRNMFQHELTHYKQLDIFYKWITQIAVCLHWFNPLMYVISKEINKSCELSCDEAVIKSLDKKSRINYGDTLIAYLKSDGNYSDTIVSITLSENSNLLKERLEAILKFNKKSKFVVALSLLLTTIMFCGAIATGAYAASANISDTLDQQELASVSQIKNIKNINLVAENCNITMRHSVNSQFLYDYNQTTHKVTPTINGSTIEINARRISNAPSSSFTDMVVIYLPDQLYDNITVEGKKAGILLPELNANLHLTNYGGSMGARVPEGFNKTVDFKNMNGSGALEINSKAKDYTLKVTSQSSAVGVSSNFPAFTPNRTWEYKNGNGNAKINLDLQGCAFSIALSEDTRKNPDGFDMINPDDKSTAVINLNSNGQKSLIHSSSFKASAGQVLTLEIKSTINGTVDLFLFSPSNKEQRITIGGNNDTKTINLSEGTWAYNCTGFFDSGNISIIGTIK